MSEAADGVIRLDRDRSAVVIEAQERHKEPEKNRDTE
jgi:hypothetical protein